MHARKPKRILNKSEGKAEKCEFVSGSMFDGIKSRKIINCFPDRILYCCPKRYCLNKTVPDGLNLLVSVSKFGIDTTKNAWYRIGVVSI